MNDSDIDSDYLDDNNMQSRKRSHAGINQLIEAIQELDVGNETDESDDDSEFDTNIPIISAARAAGTMLVSLFDVDDVHNDSPVIPDFLDASLFTFLLQTSDGVTLEYIGDVEEQEENAYDDDEYSNDSNNDDEYDEHGILFDSQLDRRFNHHQYYSEDFVVAGCTVPADDSIPPTAECAIKFLKLCQDRNVLSTLLKFGVHYFEQNNSFCFQSVVFDLTSKFHKGGNTDLIWELNIFLPSYFCIKKSDLIRPNYNGFVRDDNDMLSRCQNEDDCDIMWDNGASNLSQIKEVLRDNLVVGVIDGLPSIMEGIMKDFNDWKFWVRYLNSSIKAAMNKDGTLMNVMHPKIRPHFPALEPIFKCLDELHDFNNIHAVDPKFWIQVTQLIKEARRVTHAFHLDKYSPKEAQKMSTAAGRTGEKDPNRCRIALGITLPHGYDEGKKKITGYRCVASPGTHRDGKDKKSTDGLDCLKIGSWPGGFIMMKSSANGKEPIFEIDGVNYYCSHGIYNNSWGVSLMAEVTLKQAGRISLHDAADCLRLSCGVPIEMNGPLDYYIPNIVETINTTEGKLAKDEAEYLQTCKDNLDALLLFISNNAGQFPHHTASKNSDERHLYYFWMNRTAAIGWIRLVQTDPDVAELYSEVESLCQQSPKMVEAKYLQTCKDNLDALLLFISNNAGQFPHHTASKNSDERYLYNFWERRTVAKGWIRFVQTDPGVAELYSEIESLSGYLQTCTDNLDALLLFISNNAGQFPHHTASKNSDERHLYYFWNRRTDAKGWIRFVQTDPSVAELYSEIESLSLKEPSPKSSSETTTTTLYQQNKKKQSPKKRTTRDKLEAILLFINENDGRFPEKNREASENSLHNVWSNRKCMIKTDPGVAELYSEIESLYQQKLGKQSPKSSSATKTGTLSQRRSRGRAQLVELLENKQNVTDPHQRLEVLEKEHDRIYSEWDTYYINPDDQDNKRSPRTPEVAWKGTMVQLKDEMTKLLSIHAVAHRRALAAAARVEYTT